MQNVMLLFLYFARVQYVTICTTDHTGRRQRSVPLTVQPGALMILLTFDYIAVHVLISTGH